MLYVISSRNRLSGTASDFTYDLKLPPTATKVCVMSALIPKSYYLVREGYNMFYLLEQGDGFPVATRTVTIPPGNYNRPSFQAQLEQALNDATFYGITYTVSWPDDSEVASTGKFKFTFDKPHTATFMFPEARVSNIFELMGFEPNESYAFAGASVPLYSPNVIKLQKEDCLLLQSDICSSTNTNANNAASILQEIYASGGFTTYSNIVYQNMGNVEGYARKIINQNHGVFRFWLTNEDNEYIDLNGLNYIFTLRVW